MPPGSGEDMTACFGGLDVKTIPQRVFSCYPNRPQLAASVYCRHGGKRSGEEEGGCTVERLGKDSPNGFSVTT